MADSQQQVWQMEAETLQHSEIAPGFFLLELKAEEPAKTALPGQFVMIRAGQGLDPLLRRPFSIHRVQGDTMSILYRVVGSGTRLLSRLKPGERVDLVGPLGRGFSIPAEARTIVLVGGGIGIAPLGFLAEHIRITMDHVRLILYYGARTGGELLRLDWLEKLDMELRLATEDGSKGEKGLVTRVLERDMKNLSPALYCACGPEPMLKAMARLKLAEEDTMQVSLEANMACGLGACLGCAVETRGGYGHVCQDGPVFSLEDLPW
jgi:dihydroorotate dehydrogenase electron transfer subunit